MLNQRLLYRVHRNARRDLPICFFDLVLISGGADAQGVVKLRFCDHFLVSRSTKLKMTPAQSTANRSLVHRTNSQRMQ